MGNSIRFEVEGKKLKRLPYSERVANLLTYSYYAHDDTLDNNPEVLVAFGRAMAKSLLTCNLAPRWCVKTLWKYFPHLEPKPEEMDVQFARQVCMLQSTMKGYFAFPPGKLRRFGEYPDKAFQNLIAILHEGGELATADMNPSAFYTNEFVDQINDFDVSAIEFRARTLE